MITFRDYEEKDFEEVKAIHEASLIDYKMPDLNSPLFLVKRVAECDGKVVALYGMQVQVECYLMIAKGEWETPFRKMAVIEELNEQAMQEAWLQGVNCAVCYIPPGMKKFAKRVQKDLGFSKPREGWMAFSRRTKQ